VGLSVIGFVVSAAGLAADTFTFWQNTGQSLAGLAILALPLLMRRRPGALKSIVVLLGITALFFGTYGFLGGAERQGDGSPLSFLDSWAPLGRPGVLSDSLLTLMAIAALLSAFGTRASAAGGVPERPNEAAPSQS